MTSRSASGSTSRQLNDCGRFWIPALRPRRPVRGVRLLLDEMWTPTIALELRKRDFDVIAISEPAHAGR